MFDRAACSATRRGDHPQVEITALISLQVLLAEVTGADSAEPVITSISSYLSADLTSYDQNQGGIHAPTSRKDSSVRAVRPIGLQCGDNAGMAEFAETDAPEGNRSDGAVADGTRPGARDRVRARSLPSDKDRGGR